MATAAPFTIADPTPVANNDTTLSEPDQPVTINVLGNDRDDDPITVIAATPTSGTVTINADGTITLTPEPGFTGIVTIVYTISDGQGVTATATATVLITPSISIVPPATIETGIPGPTAPATTGIAVEGAVLSAVHGVDDLGGIANSLPTGITASGIVDAAAHRISGLGGLTQGERIDPREINPVWRLQNLINQRFGHAEGTWNPEGLTGFSLRYTFAADQTGEAQIVMESLVRERTLIVNLSSTQIKDHATVVEYKVMQADGKPLPNWLSFAGSNVLIGERPVDQEVVKLRVIALMSDGSTIERHVVIQTTSGEIQPLESKRADVAPMFSDQLDQYANAEDQSFDELLRALAG
jgi:Cadherin-like domain